MGAGCTLLAKTSEIQRDWLFVYEFRSLKLQGRFCLVLIFNQSVSLKLCMFSFPDGTAKESVPSQKGWSRPFFFPVAGAVFFSFVSLALS